MKMFQTKLKTRPTVLPDVRHAIISDQADLFLFGFDKRVQQCLVEVQGVAAASPRAQVLLPKNSPLNSFSCEWG
jgi:hypothetical protein